VNDKIYSRAAKFVASIAIATREKVAAIEPAHLNHSHANDPVTIEWQSNRFAEVHHFRELLHL
jgi:hypothetical protein